MATAMAKRPLRISKVGLRGEVGTGLTAAHVIDFASAFGTMLETRGAVLLGRDPRASGVMLREGVVAALLACGRDVIDLGVVSTPVVQHCIRRLNAAGGVSIGASHNAASWNALKFFGPNGTYLSSSEADELLDIYHLRKFAYCDWQAMGVLRSDEGALDAYIDELADAFDLDSLKRFRVLVDCTNGTSSLILARMKERFGLDLLLINAQLEGVHFAHEPSTSARIVGQHLAPLIPAVKADAGFLFDLDSDRVAMATADGEPVSEEIILPLIADYLLPRSEGKLVVTNLSTTALVDEVCARHGGRVMRTAVGRQAAIDALAGLRPEQVALAGEGTGAVMMPRFRFVYDGIASMLAVLSMMAERGQRLAEILATYPRFEMLKGTVPLQRQRIPALLMDLEEEYSDGTMNRLDGLRVDWPSKWFHVRVSQTEPIVRVICEHRGPPPNKLFAELMERVRRSA